MQIGNAAAAQTSQVNNVQKQTPRKPAGTAESKPAAPAADSVSISDAARNMLAANSTPKA